MPLSDYQFSGYDMPSELFAKPVSRAVEDFVTDLFVYSGRDGIRTAGLSPAELDLARALVRRNLRLNFVHIIEAAGVLRDPDAIPELESMLERQADLSRRLSIAGSLWRIQKHPAFYPLLRAMADNEDSTLKQAHIDQITWLEDERAIDLLIDLLADKDGFVRHLALSRLNAVEHKRAFLCRTDELPCQADRYISARHDPALRTMMVDNLVAAASALGSRPEAPHAKNWWNRLVGAFKGNSQPR